MRRPRQLPRLTSALAGLTLALLTGLAGLAGPATAQTAQTVQTAQSQPAQTAAAVPAMLVADRVFITADRQLIAEGHVEAFQGDTRLQAKRISFDRESGKLSIDGPIRIDQGGTVTVLADAAEMDRGLQNGLLSGARMVFDQQVQLAALQMVRVGGRYSQLYKTSVTSCRVCEDGRPPLWQIRARTVTHDQKQRQLYFQDAQFRILDVPVFYFPALRLPDPSLERARGFLIPTIRTTSQLNTGIKVPYFLPIGPHKDLTVEPYLSSKTRTLNLRYRQAFRHGRITLEGAYTRDDLLPGEDRGYLFGTGGFDLGNDFRLDFDIKTASDDAYLVDYGLPDLDRLRSEVALTRTKRDSAFRAALVHYDSLRDGEDESLLPTGIADLSYERRFFPTRIGGEARMAFDLHEHSRSSDTDIDGLDIARATVDLSWRRDWIFANGLRADWELGFAADRFAIRDHSLYPSEATRRTPRSALSLRYPLAKTSAGGVSQILEPVVQLGWTDVTGDAVPVDESGLVEFDQGNLLSLSRFPAVDAREDGATLVYGLNWARFAPSGWQASAAVGQVVRSLADANFTITSGLSGDVSDLLLAGQLKTAAGLALTARGLLDDGFGVNKAELRGDWRGKRSSLSGSYLWLGSDLAEGRDAPVSELWFDGSYRVNPNWTASANLRYDIADDSATRAGVGLIYRNECVTVDLSLNRRYTSSTSVEPSTDFGFTIALSGFAVDSGTQKYRRSCGKS